MRVEISSSTAVGPDWRRLIGTLRSDWSTEAWLGCGETLASCDIAAAPSLVGRTLRLFHDAFQEFHNMERSLLFFRLPRAMTGCPSAAGDPKFGSPVRRPRACSPVVRWSSYCAAVAGTQGRADGHRAGRSGRARPDRAGLR